MGKTSCFLLTCLFLSGLSAAEAVGPTGTNVPPRSAIPESYRWKLEDIYKTNEQWEADFKSVLQELPGIEAYRGKLGESAKTLLACLQLRDEISRKVDKLLVYAVMRSHEDTTNTAYQALADRATSLSVRVGSAFSFIQPEILAIPEGQLEAFIASDPGFEPYRFFLSDLLRQKAHVLPAPEEALLAQAGEIAQTPENTFSMLTNADMKFPTIRDEKGQPVEMSEERYQKFIRSPERRVREDAFDALYSTYGSFKNTLASTLSGSVKATTFYARARRYPSALDAALDGWNIPKAVYDNVVNTVEQNLGPLHRYVTLRKKILGVKSLHMYDLYVPLFPDPYKEIPYEQAQKIIEEALSPLGPDYGKVLSEGFSQRWVDVYENQGKRSGAYSWGSYDTHPYILMNYNGTINDVFTLAHEMGHSIHSYYSNKNQPYINAGYTTFVAEVASTTNEALLLQDLISKTQDRNEKLFLLNYRLEQIRTTFYRQAMFASFERTVHARAEAGEALTPDALCKLWHDMNVKYYGPDMVVDPEIDIEWARIPHFYSAFYVYQYATGYAAATSFSRQILKQGAPARDRYLHFLTRGGSAYSIDILRDAGVDLTRPDPLLDTVRVFEQTLDEMEKLL